MKKSKKITIKERETLIIENFRKNFNMIKRVNESPLEPIEHDEVEYIDYQINPKTNEIELHFNSSTLGDGYYSIPLNAEELMGLADGMSFAVINKDINNYKRSGQIGQYLDNVINNYASKYVLNAYNSGRIENEELFGGRDGLEYDDYRG